MKHTNTCWHDSNGLVQKYIGTAYDKIKLVADNMDMLQELVDSVKGIQLIFLLTNKSQLEKLNTDYFRVARMYDTDNFEYYNDYMFDLEFDEHGEPKRDEDGKLLGTWNMLGSVFKDTYEDVTDEAIAFQKDKVVDVNVLKAVKIVGAEATSEEFGTVKLFATLGDSEEGTITQKALTDIIAIIQKDMKHAVNTAEEAMRKAESALDSTVRGIVSDEEGNDAYKANSQRLTNELLSKLKHKNILGREETGAHPATAIQTSGGASVEDALNELEDRTIGQGVKIYHGTDSTNGIKHVQNGDAVPAGTTHLAVVINGKVEDVAMSPVVSGVVANLTEVGATIGGAFVDFINAVNGYKGEWYAGAPIGIGDIYGYQGSEWRSLTGANVEPVEGSDWHKIIDQKDITTGQEALIDGVIFPKKGDLEVGMTVPAGTTHLRVLVSGEPSIVAMSSLESGLVTALSENRATIGSEIVDLFDSSSPLKDKESTYAALLSRVKIKPTVKPIFDKAISDVQSATTYYRDSRQLGLPSGIALVPPSIVASSGATTYRSELVLMGEVSAGETIDCSLTVSDTSSLEVVLFGSSLKDGTGSVISTLTPSGNTYTLSTTATGSYQYVGFRLRYTGSATVVTDISMDINSTKILNMSDILRDHHSSVLASKLDTGGRELLAFVEEDFGSYFAVHFGVASGVTNNVLYCSGDATPVSSTGSTITNRAKGLSLESPATINTAIVMGQQMVKNGFSRPKIVLLPGVYDADIDGLNAAIRGDYISDDDCYILAPFGVATITATSSDYGLFSLSDNANGATLYMYQLEFDSINNPIVAQYLDIVALKCKTNSGVEGWDIDDCNATLQECWAETATNDGFNSHGSGHTALIDCYAYDNGDDGFSPHDRCTYEVWGGQYGRNGKGNIIPAFGAQGYCVGVSSREDKKTSSRIDGENYGGFVCLSGNEKVENLGRETILMLVDCVSYKDNLAVNSSGYKSTVIMANNRLSTSFEVKINQGEWQANGHGCIIEVGNQELVGGGADRAIVNGSRYIMEHPHVGSADT